jgi:hypothetical protein
MICGGDGTVDWVLSGIDYTAKSEEGKRALAVIQNSAREHKRRHSIDNHHGDDHTITHEERGNPLLYPLIGVLPLGIYVSIQVKFKEIQTKQNNKIQTKSTK